MHENRPLAAERDNRRTGAEALKNFGLPERVLFAGDQFAFILVRQKHIHVRKQAVEVRQVLALCGHDDVEHRLDAAGTGRGENGNQLFLRDAGHHEIAAKVEYSDLIQKLQWNVGRPEVAIGAERVDEAPILALYVDDKGLARIDAGTRLDGGHIDVCIAQDIGDDATKDISADAPDDGDARLHLGEIDGRVRRTAANGQQHAVGHHEFASRGEMRDRRTHVIRDDDAGAKDVDHRLLSSKFLRITAT